MRKKERKKERERERHGCCLWTELKLLDNQSFSKQLCIGMSFPQEQPHIAKVYVFLRSLWLQPERQVSGGRTPSSGARCPSKCALNRLLHRARGVKADVEPSMLARGEEQEEEKKNIRH